MTEINKPDPKAAPPYAHSSVEHQFLMALARLFQLLRIHLPNNRLVVDSLEDLRQALRKICQTADEAGLRIYRERIYLNHKKMIFDSSMTISANKLVEYLEAREIQEIKMRDRGDLTNEDLTWLINLMNQAGQVKDPLAWLQVELAKARQNWVEIKAAGAEPKDDSVNGLASLASIDAAWGASSTDEGQGEKVGLSQARARGKAARGEQLAESSGAEGDFLSDLARQTYAQALASITRKTYAHALTSILSISVKNKAGKKVGIQKSKRVIQGLIEILIKDESILLGMSTLRKYDDYTYTHSVNVAILSICIGRRLGLSRHQLEQLGLCGLFHDLGKIDVPIELISKSGKLLDHEYEKVKTHSINSVRQIIKLKADHALKAKLLLPPFEHHLGVDLQGYPQSDRLTPLSLPGRILAVADHYDALTSSRSYRQEPVSPDMALKIMMDEAGTALDPVVLKVFIGMMGVYPVGSLLVLDSKEVALAAKTPENAANGRPIVCILSRGRDNKVRKSKFLDLGERHPETGDFLRNVKQCFHPSLFDIQPADFLV